MDKNLALETLKTFVDNTDNAIAKDAILALHPELAESEDEKIRKALLRCCDDWEKGQFGCMNASDIPAVRAWLEKQKEQSTLNFYVPEGADMNSTKNKIAVILGQYKSQGFIEDEEYYSMLKYIGEKEQKPTEWSEKDDALLKEIVSFFKDGTVKLQHDLDLYAGFLENKFKSLRLQPHWKPSEEQMGWLESAVKLSIDKPYIHGIIISLYEQLNRLYSL